MRYTARTDDDPTTTTSAKANRRKWWIFAGLGCATVLATAVVAETVLGHSGADSGDGTIGTMPSTTSPVGTSDAGTTGPPAVDPRPFYDAVDRLADAPVIDYTMSDLGVEWELSMTRSGDAVGTATIAGLQADVLLADGATYIRFEDGLLSVAPPELPAIEQQGSDIPATQTPSGDEEPAAGPGVTWVLADDQATPFGPAPEDLLGSAELSEILQGELDLTVDFTDTEGLATEIDDTSVIGIRTPGYEIYVSREAPHDVVRLTPRADLGTMPDLSESAEVPDPGASEEPELPELPDLSELPELPDLPDLPDLPALPALPELPELPEPPELPAGFGDPELDVDVRSADDAEALQTLSDIYSLLLEQSEQLVDAVDPGVSFDLSSTVSVVCGGTCTATVPISATPAGRDVDARAQVTFTVDGLPAGTCQAAGRIPGGVGSLSCSSPQAAALGNSRLSQKMATAPPGTTVYVDILAEASISATVLPDDEVEDLLMQMYEDYLGAIEDICSLADLAAQEDPDPGAEGSSAEGSSAEGSSAEEENTCGPALEPPSTQ